MGHYGYHPLEELRKHERNIDMLLMDAKIAWTTIEVTGDPDLLRIGVCYGPNALASQRPTRRMIQRSVPVRAVKTRRQFSSKTASFHVSVCSCIFSLFLFVYIIRMLPISFHLTV